YSLPTEAQWEYACRAGTTTGLYSGKECTSTRGVCPNVDEIAWYDQNSSSQTHVVGQKQPNAWGLYDMAGNVTEWCLDWKGAYPSQAVTDPTGPETGTFRVLRGGDWNNYAQYARSAARNSNLPSSGVTSSIGFRVALVASASQPSDEPVPGSSAIISLPNNVDLDMIWIDPGTFTMGSPTDELGRESDETQHKVTLTNGYWLGKYEVIQAQYEAVMGTNPSTYKGTDLPVETVSWYDAKEFCAKLTEIEKAAGRLPEGYEYTLPTEAQWEYACRAGTTTSLNSGKNLTNVAECPNMDEVGWYWYNAGIESYYQGLICTHPVGQKQSNGWGLYDMHGSVGEWCLDCYGDYPASAVSDPIGADTSAYRVCRGGSWGNYAWNCRSADRNCHSCDVGSSQVGFRLALAPVK
ncbi:MAG: formylglycine-generating enzyme family protein, partial [Verrucomicrobia bacterium]|nr:formylglycine-generating enzyme family protein [Verrucomicrobiota bacterium]